MNKVFSYAAGTKCDECLLAFEHSLPYIAVLTAEGAHPTLHFFIGLRQFCSEHCRTAYIAELNVMPGVFSPESKYVLVKGG